MFDFDCIVRQGWNEDTVQLLVERFIEKRGLMNDLEEFLENIAKEEENECNSSNN